MVTPIYAALLAIIFIFLTFRVIKLRRGKGIGIGHEGDELLLRAITTHTHFIEFVPLSLLLLFFLEYLTQATILVHILGVILIISRILHAYGVSQIKENYRFRVFGMILNIGVILSASIRILISYI